MTFRIQKTIISKYLDLVEQDLTTEAQISELRVVIENLYKSRIHFSICIDYLLSWPAGAGIVDPAP